MKNLSLNSYLMVKYKHFSPKIKIKTRMSMVTTSPQHYSESPS